MSKELCNIIFRSHYPGDPIDNNGCIKPDGHNDDHEFVLPNGQHVIWSFDYGCTCGCNDDFDAPGEQESCIIYQIIDK